MQSRPQQLDVQRIADVRAPWCVTVYGDVDAWLRGNHATETAGSQIRAAVSALRAAGASQPVIDAVRERLTQVANPASRATTIDRRARTIAVFATEHDVEVFTLTSSAQPWVGVADRFLIGPLLEGALALLPPFFVLALSEKQVRLIDVTAHPARLVDTPGLPADLESTIALDLTGDRETLAHLRTSEDPKVRLREYSRAIDRVVAPALRHAGAVLVLAATEPLASIYRSETSHPLVTSSAIAGNHDGATVEALADLAAPIVEAHRRDTIESHLTRYAELPARGLVLADLEGIARAAQEGAIETLFVDVDRRIGVPAEAFESHFALDRVDEIVRHAMSSGADIVPVHADDLPTPDPVAAVLRYALQTTD